MNFPDPTSLGGLIGYRLDGLAGAAALGLLIAAVTFVLMGYPVRWLAAAIAALARAARFPYVIEIGLRRPQ